MIPSHDAGQPLRGWTLQPGGHSRGGHYWSSVHQGNSIWEGPKGPAHSFLLAFHLQLDLKLMFTDKIGGIGGIFLDIPWRDSSGFLTTDHAFLAFSCMTTGKWMVPMLVLGAKIYGPYSISIF